MSIATARQLAAIEAAVKEVCEAGDRLVEADWDYFEAVEPTVDVRRIRGWWALDIAVTITQGGETTSFEETMKTGLDWPPDHIAMAVNQALTEICEADRTFGELTVDTVKKIRMQRWVDVLIGQAMRGGA